MITRRRSVLGLGSSALAFWAVPSGAIALSMEPHDIFTDPAFMLGYFTGKIDVAFNGVDGLPCSRCETGDFYVTLTGGGLKREGDPFPSPSSTERQAVEWWCDQFVKYAADKNGRLYWRHRPEIEHYDGKVVVYSRLVISDKPELSEGVQRGMGIIP